MNGGSVELLINWILSVSNDNLIILMLFSGLFLTITTSLGALIAIFSKNIPSWGINFSLSFAAGIMLVASFTSLILPSIEISHTFLPSAIGIFLGILLMLFIDKSIPHEHLVKGYEGPPELKTKFKLAWLLVFAMIVHNFPEGLAVGSALAFDHKNGLITAIAIGLQDIPEGTVVALPLAVLQKSRLKPILIGILSGFAEFITVIIGALFLNKFRLFLPYGLSLAGGAMLYITIKELIPEIYKSEKNELLITAGFFLGFYIMLYLDSM
jgi:ZIP family zinc transporter